MAGKECPKCKELTFFETTTGRECTNCGCIMVIPPNDGKGGCGTKCSNCESWTVFNGKCSNCGAKYY